MQDMSALWKDFCKNLEAAGESVLSSDLALSELDKAEGVRYLTRLLRIGLDMHLENANPAFPNFYQASHATAKIGSDNPDNFYQNATISGAHNYRIWGKRGSVPILSFGTKANRYAIDGSMASTGELDIRDVKTASDGSFEIFVSKKRRGENWLPLEDDSTMLIVRQTFFDRSKEIAADVFIEGLHEAKTPNPLETPDLADSLNRVPAFISGTSEIFLHWANIFRRENKNALNTADQTMFSKAGGDPMIHYLHGWWEFTEGQALLITSDIPKCEGWNFQINNIWMESLDYRHHNIHTNNGLAKLNPDGSVTLIISPSVPLSFPLTNWIDTASHSKGTMLWRWTGAQTHPIPTVKIIETE